MNDLGSVAGTTLFSHLLVAFVFFLFGAIFGSVREERKTQLRDLRRERDEARRETGAVRHQLRELQEENTKEDPQRENQGEMGEPVREVSWRKKVGRNDFRCAHCGVQLPPALGREECGRIP